MFPAVARLKSSYNILLMNTKKNDAQNVEELYFGASVRRAGRPDKMGKKRRGARREEPELQEYEVTDDFDDGSGDGRKRHPWLIAFVVIMVIVALVGGCLGGWWMYDNHWRKVAVTVNGSSMEVRVDTTAARLLKDNADFGTKRGNLVDVSGATMKAGAGKPIVVSIDGTAVPEAKLDSTVIPANSMVMVTSGEDVVEPHTVKRETVPHGEQINIIGGAIQYRKQLGSDGVHEYWTGKQSGKQVDKGITKQPRDLIVEALNPRPSGKKVIALTFDDGPSQYSGPILDILKKKHVKATFFDVGEESVNFPELEKRMLAEGHQVASHSNTHPDMPTLSRDALRAEITAGFANMEKASGHKTKVLRSPYGAFGKKQWQQTYDLISMNVLWDIDTEDWKRPGADKIHDAVMSGAHNGAIVLMHDGGGDRTQDIEALPGIIDDLKKQGYEFVTIEQLLKMSGDVTGTSNGEAAGSAADGESATDSSTD